MYRLIAVFGLSFAFAATLTACGKRAQESGVNDQYVQGQQYEVLSPPVATTNPNKIEVVEVFSYGCSHCFHFEPLLQSWEKRQLGDVYLTQIHAMWNPQMEPLIRGYYASLMLNIQDRTHMDVFNALQRQNVAFNTADEWGTFFAGYGVDKDAAVRAYNSFGVSSRVKQAEVLAREYKITGTPEMVVNGKYRVSSELTGSQEEMLKVVDFLVAKERSEKKP